MWDIDWTLIEEWLMALDNATYLQVRAALGVLASRGPQLGRPLVDTVKQSKHKNMKELRPGSSGKSEIRILFAFDPDRRAILLLGGDKSQSWQRWYQTNVPLADALLDEHLNSFRREMKHGKDT